MAEDFLMEELGDGAEIPCKHLYRKAEDKGISNKVLWPAANKLKVKKDKGGFNVGWLWQLPKEISPEDS